MKRALTANLLPILALAASTLMLISPANAISIQQEIVNNCIKDTVEYKVADKKTATKLCTCTTNVQSKITFGQMWEANSYARSGKDPSVLPHVKKTQKAMQQCAKGLKLSPPQKPE